MSTDPCDGGAVTFDYHSGFPLRARQLLLVHDVNVWTESVHLVC